MSDPKKPALDEPALGKLLEAAFVIQEHQGQASREQPSREQESDRQNQPPKVNAESFATKIAGETGASASTAAMPASPSSVSVNLPPSKDLPTSADSSISENSRISAPPPAPPPAAKPIAQDDYAAAMARIVETQQQILARGLGLESAMALVAQRLAEITKANGAAIGLLETEANGKTLQYRAVSGELTLPLGSKVPKEKALSFNCLRSGELMRAADVNADLLLDAAECRRRGIGALIAVPIYHDGGIAGALELYFRSANAFSEQDVHSSQLMAGLITEALAREAGATSRKSLAAERATMLEALEKLRPNLAAIMETPAVKEASAVKGARPGTEPALNGLRVKSAAAAKTTAPVASVSVTESPAIPPTPAKPSPIPAGQGAGSATQKNAAPVFVCRKCGHELVGEEMFCGKCGSPRSSDYQAPTMQSKLALLWQRQQALNPSLVSRPPNSSTGSEAVAAAKNHHGIPTEIEPWESVLSQLRDPFAEPGPGPEPEFARSPAATQAESAAEVKAAAFEISAAAGKISSGFDAFHEAGKDTSTKTQAVEESKLAEKKLAEKKLDGRTAGKAIIETGFLDEARRHEDRLHQNRLDEDRQNQDRQNQDRQNKDRLGEDRLDQDRLHDLLREHLRDQGFDKDLLEEDSLGEISPNINSFAGKDDLGSIRAAENDEDGHQDQVGEIKEAGEEHQAHDAATEPATTTALATTHPLAWTSAAKAKEAFDQLAAARQQNSFLRFWNTHRGDIYLAVAVVLLAAVVRWSLTADHTSGGSAAAVKTSHRRPAADADLSTFDKLLISLGLADAPDPPEDKGNPDTQVWVDSRSAIYYCPGADLYGKTPQGRYTTQRDAQLGQFEPAYRKACN